MTDKILVATHRSGVIEMDLKKFNFYSSLYASFFPEYDRTYKKEGETPEEEDWDQKHKRLMKQRRREFSKTEEFRSVPIENTEFNWWRDRKTKKNPQGRKQQMVQYEINSKLYHLPVSKPYIGMIYRKWDHSFLLKEQKGWKKNKKVKKHWMKKKANHESIKGWNFFLFDEFDPYENYEE